MFFPSDCFIPELFMLSFIFVTTKQKEQEPHRPKLRSCSHQHMICMTQSCTYTMITIETKNFNPVSQVFYDKTINSLNLNNLSCTCGHSACLIRYGSYERYIRSGDRKILFFISRVRCKECRRTHALLLSSFIPYSQIPFDVMTDIIRCYEHHSGYGHILAVQLLIDENTISSVSSSYRRHWKQRLLSVPVSINDSAVLISGCFHHFSRQFMQIKRTPNLLFLPPT